MSINRDEQALSAAFAHLPLDQQEALESPPRRRILRFLHGGSGPQSPADLAARIAASLSTVSYHARVLSACGLIDLATARPVRGTVRNWYVPAATEDANVATILAATAAGDGGR